MVLPDIVTRITACAPGKRITVVMPDGKVYALPRPPEPAPVVPPHPLEAISQQLLARAAEGRAAAASIVESMAGTLNAVREVVGSVTAGQAQVVASINEMSGTLHLPVKPVYDDAGKLIGAKRVKKLGD